MSIGLDRPLDLDSLSAEQQRMLSDLQGNILKPHGRDHAIHLFLRFDDGAGGRACLRKLAGAVTSSAEQAQVSRQLRGSGLRFSGRLFLGIGITHAGYRKLAIADDDVPRNAAFVEGMRARGPVALRDPPVAEWDPPFRQEIHAIAIVAHETADAARTYADAVAATVSEASTVLGEEVGSALRARDGSGERIEHFGYADGLSQIVFFKQDVAGTPSKWNPLCAPSLVLERCGSRDETSFGSYFVFRKLEQNPRLFAEVERRLAEMSGAALDDAGARLIGRHKDGTSLVVRPVRGAPSDPTNDFDYAQDTDGTRCPIGAHVRKLNPRGSTGPVVSIADRWERPHAVARRSITYGDRADDPRDATTAAERPEHGVGLLFMCCQHDIRGQFETIQGEWAQQPFFPDSGVPTGIDTMIGRPGAVRSPPAVWKMPGGRDVTLEMPRCVAPKGGEYFFLPSISFLKSL